MHEKLQEMFSLKPHDMIARNQQATRGIHITTFARQHESFHGNELSNRSQFKLDLRYRYCDCGKFQTDRYPCHHVIACYSN